MSPQKSLTEAVHRLARRRDDGEAWAALFAASWPTALATTYRVLGGELDLAEDAAQEAYTRIVRYCDFGKLVDGNAFLAYLQVVCRNTARDVRRHLVADRAHAALDRVDEASSVTHGREFEPEQLLGGIELRHRLLKELDEPDQRLFSLLVEGRSLTEIAAALGVSYSAAGVRVHRLRERLRKRL